MRMYIYIYLYGRTRNVAIVPFDRLSVYESDMHRLDKENSAPRIQLNNSDPLKLSRQ